VTPEIRARMIFPLHEVGPGPSQETPILPGSSTDTTGADGGQQAAPAERTDIGSPQPLSSSAAAGAAPGPVAPRRRLTLVTTNVVPLFEIAVGLAHDQWSRRV
jgi:hypothetical protein